MENTRRDDYQTENSGGKSRTKKYDNIKIGNTFSVLQEDDQEPILEEELPQLPK